MVEEDQLDGLFDLQLIKPEFEQVAAAGEDEVIGELGLPLNQGLDMLRDKQRNISLSIPLSGDISDPRFHFDDIF